MNKLIILLFLQFFTQMVSAQYQIGLVPRTSPDKAIFQKIGFTEVEITYGSPAVKNRQIWGNVVPYNEVWRAGANNATTIEFGSEIIINNMPLDSGKYAFFIIPKEENKWTVIFNKIHKQWGAFQYNEEEDALRIDVIPRRKIYPTENLTYAINQLGYQYGSIILNWGEIEIEVPFETKYLEKFQQDVETKVNQQPEHLKWIVYLQGAEHLEQIGLNQDVALSWINQAEKIMNATSTSEWNQQFYPRDYIKGHLYWIKAKLLADDRNFLEAINYVEMLKKIENKMFYNRKNEKEGINILSNNWKKNNH